MDNNYFYVLQAASACGQTTDSKRIGEFDFAIVPEPSCLTLLILGLITLATRRRRKRR